MQVFNVRRKFIVWKLWALKTNISILNPSPFSTPGQLDVSQVEVLREQHGVGTVSAPGLMIDKSTFKQAFF